MHTTHTERQREEEEGKREWKTKNRRKTHFTNGNHNKKMMKLERWFSGEVCWLFYLLIKV